MNLGKFPFAQVIEHLPLHVFHRCVVRYSGKYTVKWFSCLDQYLCMAFAQLTYRESLRDIEACLRVQSSKLYHLGFRSSIARNTLANANATRDWRIYCDFAQSLIGTAQATLRRRGARARSQGHRLRARCHHDRSVSLGLSLGAVPLDQSGGQAAHALGFAGQYPVLHLHQRRQAARRQYPRSVGARARCHLHHGSRIHRLRSARSLSSDRQLLRHPCQD
jgi:hypothetical protein